MLRGRQATAHDVLSQSVRAHHTVLSEDVDHIVSIDALWKRVNHSQMELFEFALSIIHIRNCGQDVLDLLFLDDKHFCAM